jgi:hypothetical protein
LVSWLRKKQSSISLSTAEAEYIAETTCCTQVLWMKQTLTDIQVEYDEPIPIYCDNTSAINISKNPVMHSKTKHIPIKYHFLQEQVAEKNIRVEYVGTKEQGEIMKVGYTFACFMRKKTVFSQVIQLPTYKSIFFI